jgi:D-alanyl-D-alanine carboxypeptidase
MLLRLFDQRFGRRLIIVVMKNTKRKESICNKVEQKKKRITYALYRFRDRGQLTAEKKKKKERNTSIVIQKKRRNLHNE